jgi:NADH-quinone oxidoreductase subunit K
MIALSDFLVLGAIMFCLSIAGIFINRKNVIILLMAIELMLLAVNMNFVAFSHFLGDTAGQVFVFFILTVAAAEAAIGAWQFWSCCSVTDAPLMWTTWIH